jgi:hypothetical protein
LDAGESVTVNSNSDEDAEDDAGDGNDDFAPPAPLLPLDLPMVASTPPPRYRLMAPGE